MIPQQVYTSQQSRVISSGSCKQIQVNRKDNLSFGFTNKISFRSLQPVRKLSLNIATDTAKAEVSTEERAKQALRSQLQIFKEYFSARAQLIDAELDKSIPERDPKIISDAMRYSLLAGGKRIRPGLCLASCEACGGSMEAAIPTACALEMIHTMSLIHDDLPSLDNDDFRRGKPTSHKQFGEDMAVLAGDALLAYSSEIIARDTVGVPPEIVLKVMCEVQRGVRRMVDGQVLDIKNQGKEGVDLKMLRQIHENKTAALLEAAVVSGALIAQADNVQVEKLRKYSQNIGLAFQVVDDILDVTASTEELGKTAAKDLYQSKTTYPKLLGLERSKQVAQELIAEALDLISDLD